MLGSCSAARPNASRLRPRSFAMARNRVPADTRTAPRAAAHRSATVVLPVPGGPPMTRIIDVPQAVSSNPPERNAHRLETPSEPDVLQDADHDLPERDGEQRVQQDPGREHVARVIQEHVVRPGHRDPLVPAGLQHDVDEEPEPREDHDEQEDRPRRGLVRRRHHVHLVLREPLLDFLELREPRLLALSHGFHILFPPRRHDLLRAGHLHPVRVVVPDDRADRRRQDAREENRQDRKGPTEAEKREQDRVRPAREPEPHLLVDDRVQGEEEQENHEEPGQARAAERRWRPDRRGRLLGRLVRRLVRRFLGLFLRYLLGIRRAGIIGHGCANGRADIRICSVASGGNQPLSAGVGAVPRADWIFVARSSYRCVRAFSCFWRDFTRIVRFSLCSSSSFFSASRSSCRTISIPMLLYTGVSSLILTSSSRVPSISRSFASSCTRWLPRTWSWFWSCWYWAIWFWSCGEISFTASPRVARGPRRRPTGDTSSRRHGAPRCPPR